MVDAIVANRSFTLLGELLDGKRGVLSLPDFMATYNPRGSRVDPAGPAHVQSSIEGNWDQYPDPGAHRYVRGCSGFAGFALGGFKRAEAEAFSRNAEAIVGHDKWRSWGSEQVASNFLIANSRDALLLPYDRYSNYWNEAPGADMRFLHFIGTHRYSTGEYRTRTRQVIAALQSRIRHT
ncbi:hypothetical protein ACFQU2_29940 [Siccirubricoccus deserti]